MTYHEHCDVLLPGVECEGLTENEYSWQFPKRRGNDQPCFTLRRAIDNQYQLETGYFIGLDWVTLNERAVYIVPKLNSVEGESSEINYIKMLFAAMKHGDVSKEVNELFHIKWDEPSIMIEQKQDMLTPLLVMEFLGVVKQIVRKGLKQSYYKVERNLHSRLKGKVLISKTVKHNLMRNRVLETYCSYDEFGINNPENRLLKKALSFIKRYLPAYTELTNESLLVDTFNYINPAFQGVSDNIEINEVIHLKSNAFFNEYDEALRLAKLILRRFGYNISNTSRDLVATPPFWIDMSKLFELYVLGLLKDRFKNKVEYQFKTYGNELDYLLNSDDYQMVIDAKYKPKWKYYDDHENARQVSGYARLNKIHQFLEKEYPESIDCLIIYPDQKDGYTDLEDVNLKELNTINYQGIWKVGVRLPTIKI